MSAEGINRFTSLVLNQLYAAYNETGNIALGGMSLYILMAAINVGLKGNSYHQLYRFLGEKIPNLFDTDNWRNSQAANQWIYRRKIVQQTSKTNWAFLSSCNIYRHYELISKNIFNLHQIKVNISYPDETAREVNEWVSRGTYGSIRNLLDESMLSNNKIFFINTLYLRADWKMNFNSGFTKKELFFDDKGQPLVVDESTKFQSSL
ncbi:Alpha-1-antiproteinase S [Thelohanellus kitauei]|uniref:Alpha-1-antiproteinase S n=1 Tax=Thelohanellus kitauei TaxID=669202 RepID=A0A0C2NF21_THEKT|nr:Alpha-1-antiproteinase S [Thelohanellus kitauei]